MKKISLTISGLVVAILSIVLPKLGINILEGDIATTITTITLIVGGLMTYIGRVRKGDITPYGVRKPKII